MNRYVTSKEERNEIWTNLSNVDWTDNYYLNNYTHTNLTLVVLQVRTTM